MTYIREKTCWVWILLIQSVVSAATWNCLTNLQNSPVMVPGEQHAEISFTYATETNSSSPQKWTISLFAANGTQIFTTTGHGVGRTQLPLLGKNGIGCAGCLFTWRAKYDALNEWSPPQTVFTAVWGEGHPSPRGMWASDNSTGRGPQFIFLRADMPRVTKKIESALLYLTADGPGRAEKKGPHGTRPLLGRPK